MTETAFPAGSFNHLTGILRQLEEPGVLIALNVDQVELHGLQAHAQCLLIVEQLKSRKDGHKALEWIAARDQLANVLERVSMAETRTDQAPYTESWTVPDRETASYAPFSRSSAGHLPTQ